MLSQKIVLFSGQEVHDVALIPGSRQILLSYNRRKSQEKGNVVLVNILVDLKWQLLAKTKSPLGSVASLSWVADERQGVFLDNIQQFVWKSGSIPRSLNLVISPLSRRVPIRLLTNPNATYLWIIELEPTVTSPDKPPSSNMTVSLQVKHGIRASPQLAVFRRQQNFPVETQLVQVNISGEQLLAIDASRTLRIYSVHNTTRSLTLPLPLHSRTDHNKIKANLMGTMPSPSLIIGFAPDYTSRKITTITEDGTVCIHDIATGKVLRSAVLPGIWWRASICHSRFTKELLIGGMNDHGPSLYLLESTGLAVKAVITPKLSHLQGIAFQENDQGRHVLCWGTGGCVIYS